MKFTNIFDMNAESSTDQNEASSSEATLNDDDEQDNVQHDIEVLLPESKEMMCDWTCAKIKIDEINSDSLESDEKIEEMSANGSSSSIESMDSFYKPEADQNEHEQQTFCEHVTSALRRESREFPTIGNGNDE